MVTNVCGMEKIIRAVLGTIIVLAGLYYSSWWGAIGLIPLLTAAVGYCPINQVFSFSSCSLRTSP